MDSRSSASFVEGVGVVAIVAEVIEGEVEAEVKKRLMHLAVSSRGKMISGGRERWLKRMLKG